MFVGAIIKETLTNELILDCLDIDKVEIWKTSDLKLKYWTMIFFKSNTFDLPARLSNVIRDGWFADMIQDNIKYIILKNCIYQYTIGNSQEKSIVLEELRKRGIPDEQFNWEE